MLIVGIISGAVGILFGATMMAVCGSDGYNKAFGDGFRAGTKCVYRHLRWETQASIEQGIQRDREWIQWRKEE
jgi:hypothetical protein